MPLPDATFPSKREDRPEKKKKNKKEQSQIVRCPFCVEGLRLPDSEDADQFLTGHFRKCWWLEKNGRGHIGRRSDEMVVESV